MSRGACLVFLLLGVLRFLDLLCVINLGTYSPIATSNISSDNFLFLLLPIVRMVQLSKWSHSTWDVLGFFSSNSMF